MSDHAADHSHHAQHMHDGRHDPDAPPHSLTRYLKDPPTAPCRPTPSPPRENPDGVFIVWNVDRRRPFLKVCHATRDEAEAFMEDLLVPYPATNSWRRKLRVAGPLPKARSWKSR